MTLKKGVWWGFIDQGFFSAGNFLASIVLARLLSPREYGVFALFYSMLLLIANAHRGLISEPFLVLGSGVYRSDVLQYLALLIRRHYALSAMGSVILAATGGFLAIIGADHLVLGILGLIVSVPFVLLLWLLRRSAYVIDRVRLAAAGSVLYFLLVLAALYVAEHFRLLNVFTSFFIFGGASVIVIGLYADLIVSPFSQSAISKDKPILEVHASYGRWSVWYALLEWIPLNVNIMLLSVWTHYSATADFKATVNLLVPVNQLVPSISLLLLPRLSRLISESNLSRFLRETRVLIILTISGAAVFVFALIGFGGQVMGFLYSGKYDASETTLIIVGCSGALIMLYNAFLLPLKSLLKQELVFRAYLMMSISAVVAGMLLVSRYAFEGAVVAFLISNAVQTIALGGYYAQQVRHKATRPNMATRP